MSRRLHLPFALLVGLLVRVPFWIEALKTPPDGDTAIVGLMARHLGRGTTLWGQPYGSPLDAWVAAPFVAAMGPTTEALRLPYFLLGLALIPLVYFLARGLDSRAALPAALLMACPPPYFLLLSSLPPPFYATSLVLAGLLLVLTLRLGLLLAVGGRPLLWLAVWGALAGLALWTHLMATSVVLAAAAYLVWRGREHPQGLFPAALTLVATSAPWWTRIWREAGQATQVLRASSGQETMLGHLAEVLPRLHEPLGGLLGARVHLLADDPESMIYLSGWIAFSLILIYGVSMIQAVRSARGKPTALLYLGVIALALAAFPFPLRSSPTSLRFLSLLYLPWAALTAWAPVARVGVRRAWVVVLLLACLHLLGGFRLLSAWRIADRSAPPYLVPDLAPVRKLLAAHGIRRAYASYGIAYRLTYESGETLLASQPWNERFLHYPLPYLDQVRFAKNVAWVLTPRIPSDLPPPRSFEEALGPLGGDWKRAQAGPAVVYHDFVPPFAPTVELLASAGFAGDGRLETRLMPDPLRPSTVTIAPPRALDAVTLLAGLDGPRLLRSMDIEVSADGAAFEAVARRRRREERADLRWVNGHPQYVLDHDVLAIPLGGRVVGAVRISPVASTDPWAIGELLLHPATPRAERRPWDEWLDPNLSWDQRREALAVRPLPTREDWYSRTLLAARAR